MPNLRGKTWTTTTPANVEDAQYWEDHLISDSVAAKAASSVQTVNSTAPDANGNVDVVALPAGGTTGQVLTKISNTSGDADWLDPSSSGHTIKDEDGVSMAQQPTLQFLNADVTNDSVNSKTVVDCKGAKGDAATVSVGTTTTLPAGSSATVTNSGTSSAAVLNFGIPEGADGDDGVSVTGVSLQSTSGKVKTYRMTFSNSTYFDFDVTDGADGTGAGDMLSTDYDPNQTVYNAGGIVAYVNGQAYTLPTASSSTLGGVKVGTNLSIDGSGVLSATDTTYVEVTTTASGLMSASDKTKLNGIASGAEVNVQADWNEADSSSDAYIANKPTIPAAQIQSDWNQADNTKLDYIKNKPSVLGHTMIPTTNDIATITALQNGNDNYVINAYSAKRWSNTDSITLLTTVAQGDDTMGTWEADDTWQTSGVRTGWLCHSLLADILSDNDTEIELVFDIADSETVSAYAYRIDDHYTVNGETVGGIAIKFNGAIQNASGVKVGVKLKHNRATYINVSRT